MSQIIVNGALNAQSQIDAARKRAQRLRQAVERLDLDRVTWLDSGSIVLKDDEAVGIAHRVQ